MGSYVSQPGCEAHYHATLNCSYPNDTSIPNQAVGGLGTIEEQKFPTDSDIAGIGVLGAFVAVTLFSVILSVINTLWWWFKNIRRWSASDVVARDKKNKRFELKLAVFLEVLVLTCSDQQIFTGGAYAVTLRYAKGCSITAYHYNVVSNMLLLTCATHVMSITISRNYWEHPFVASLRIIVTALLFIVTGVLLSNQGAGDSTGIPTGIPSSDVKYSPILLPAACFQGGDAKFGSAVQGSFSSGSARSFFDSKIPGWEQYLLMVLFYALAILVSVGRVVRRGAQEHDGSRRKFVNAIKNKLSFLFRARGLFYVLFGLYLWGGVGIAIWTIVTSGLYIVGLRLWIANSGWVASPNPENEWTTFGQLVPILLISLTIFTFLHILSGQSSFSFPYPTCT
ncbi:hypothetical protein B0T22DRAFT_369483 [Podospora appendiculata]|uniref:Uncharacterized protein n=1 Tax=Podospora appendiculata TaxID=314037 RepID=A0AAE0XGZ9_9PEZI|nr:hypothetical protein B0T22DRAFT_369483 [Podospora appendiculata]